MPGVLANVAVLVAAVVAIAASGATDPVVGEGEHHMQYAVFLWLYDVV